MPNEKDSTEKHLLNYADVFADVVNVLVFHGKEVIDPKDLVSTEARSVLTLHGKTREQERDVVKIIAFLDDDTRKLFKSDFRHVVDYLHQVRTKEEYQASAQPVKYPAEVLQLMAAFTNNNRFLDVAYEIDTRGPTNMKDLIGNMLSDSERKGELKGEQRGALKSTVDCVVNLVRSTKGNTNLNDALEMLKVPADIRDAVAKQAKALLEA